MANSIIRSPIDGVIIKRTADLGQTVAASFQTPTCSPSRAISSRCRSTPTSPGGRRSAQGGPGSALRGGCLSGRDFEGKVRQFRLSPNVTQNVVTYNVVIEVDNPMSC